MAHVLIIGCIILGYGVLAIACWLTQQWLVALFDWLWLDAELPEGPLTVDVMRRLLSSPTDGEAAVTFDQDGTHRLVASHIRRTSRH